MRASAQGGSRSERTRQALQKPERRTFVVAKRAALVPATVAFAAATIAFAATIIAPPAVAATPTIVTALALDADTYALSRSDGRPNCDHRARLNAGCGARRDDASDDAGREGSMATARGRRSRL